MGAAALMAAGGLLSAYSSIAQGNAQAAAYKAEAQAAEQNKRIAEQQSSEAIQQGAREMHKFRREAGQFAATQESQLAASGVTLSGSALNVMADTQQGIAEDVDAIRYNSMKEAWGYDAQAVQFGNQANAMRSAAKNAKSAGRLGAITTILGTGANIAMGNRLMKGGVLEPAPKAQPMSQAVSQALDVAAYLPVDMEKWQRKWEKWKKEGSVRW